MRHIQADHHIYVFAPKMAAIETIDIPSKLVLETIDALDGQITSREDRLTELDFSRVNPATGPIFIEGVKSGDTLIVRIKRIELPETGVIITGPGMGVLGDELNEYATKILPIRDGSVRFNDLELPASPMIGVIGVAPESESYPTGTAHRHGGNMDTKEIGESATLYLPVFQDGGLLALGDVHAVMGDGEVCISGCEISASVTVELDTIKGRQMNWPIVSTDEGIYIIVSLPAIDAALKEATREAVLFLERKQQISREEAAMLASLAVDVKISQLVDPNKTAKAFIPRILAGDSPFAQ